MANRFGARYLRSRWFIRSFAGKVIPYLMLSLAAGGLAGWLLNGRTAQSAFLAAIAVLAALVLYRPLTRALRKVIVRRPPWQQSHGPFEFAGLRPGFDLVARAKAAPNRAAVIEIDHWNDERGRTPIHLVLWVIARGADGRWWTRSQERPVLPTGFGAAWTATLDGQIAVVDLDAMGRADPFRTAHRLALDVLDVPLSRIKLLGWGIETRNGIGRDVVFGYAETSASASELGSTPYPGHPEPVTHMAPIDLEGLSRTLGRGHPDQWNAAAICGLADLAADLAPETWRVLEAEIGPRWQQKQRFARIERGTRSITQRLAG